MFYLFASLSAGLFYLISGKVTFNKTTYLEGTKARIAGLIFLLPAILTISIIGVVIILSAVGANISDSSSNLLDSFASTLVRNGFLIGLAYINFYSASQDANTQSGCLRYWLGYTAIISLLVFWFIPTLTSDVGLYKIAVVSSSMLQIIFIVGIWLWKKWGVFGYAATNFVSPIIAFLRIGSFPDIVISIIQSLSFILVLYLLVKPKWKSFE